jgi:RNA polymerase sigma-70 factor (ECF subfamily)
MSTVPESQITERSLDPESARWVAELRGPEPGRAAAVERLRAMLDAASRFELARRRGNLPDASPAALEAMAGEATAAALDGLLSRLHEYGGESRFSTWASKFALLEAAALARIRAWEGRALPGEAEGWARLESDLPGGAAEVRRAVTETLDREQRAVVSALALNGVPIDVLADRLGATRGAIYQVLHGARRRLRARLATGAGAREDRAAAGHPQVMTTPTMPLPVAGADEAA